MSKDTKEEKSNKRSSKHRKKEKKKDSDTTSSTSSKPRKPKRVKKNACFSEKKFVVDLVQQLKENNLGDDIWFDKDEGTIDDVGWLTSRLEAVDRCRAVVVFISNDYMSCPTSIFESKIILERLLHTEEAKKPKMFCVLLESVDLPKPFTDCLVDANAEVVDLTGQLESLPQAEKISFALGALLGRLEQIASMKTPYIPQPINHDTEFTGAWQGKHVAHWSCQDVNEWLHSIGVREFYRQSFIERGVDGYLLLATTDRELQWVLGIDSRIVRKKISNQLFQVLDKEHKQEDSWHLRTRVTRPRVNTVYLIFDPQDVRLANNIKSDLTRKGLQVLTHGKLGQSRAEFLKLNGVIMAQCSHVVCILTENSASSPFFFNEVLFCCWMGGGRSLSTAVFNNVWEKIKTPLKATLGDQISIDFETKLYSESIEVLEHHLKPNEKVAGVILEQSYLDRMTDGTKPLRSLSSQNIILSSAPTPFEEEQRTAKVFISYQWDEQERVMRIVNSLEAHGVPCWADLNLNSRPSLSRLSVRTTSSTASYADLTHSETLQTHIQRNMKTASVVLCCVTPRYSTSSNCEHDMQLAMHLNKPVLPVMLRFVSWPPEGVSERVRQMMVKMPKPVDLSNEKLFKLNIQNLVNKVLSHIQQTAPRKD